MGFRLCLVFALAVIFEVSTSWAEPAVVDTLIKTVVDGEFEDWKHISVAAEHSNAATQHPFVKSVRINHDAKSVFLFFELSRPVSLQRMADAAGPVGRLTILFDADGKTGTGWSENHMEGVDLAIDFPPRDNGNARRSAGVAVRIRAEHSRSQRTLSAYAIGFLSAPTFASDKFEIRLQRGQLELDSGSLCLFEDQLRCKVCRTGIDGLVRDELLTATYELGAQSTTDAIAAPVEPLGRSRSDLTRMVVWNTGLFGLFDEARSSSYKRVLSALNPDIVLLTEILGDCSALGPQKVSHILRMPHDDFQRRIDQSGDIKAVAKRLMSSATGTEEDDWNVVLSKNGSVERTLVATRLPVQRIDDFDEIFPAPLKYRSTSVGAIIRIGNHQILTVPVDFVSGGQTPGDTKDRDRLTQASAVKKAVMGAVSRHRIDGVIIGGDLNLVGSRMPLSHLVSLSALGAAEMKVVRATQLDGLSNITWSAKQRDQPTFGPGRLDFVLHTESPLTVEKSFVFESEDLSPQWLENYGLNKADSRICSDHFPIVVDLGVTAAD